jgi:hypothetical protein
MFAHQNARITRLFVKVCQVRLREISASVTDPISALAFWKPKGVIIRRVKYWEIIAHNLSKAGWSWGCVSTVDSRAGERSSLRTHIAATESASLCVRMKS